MRARVFLRAGGRLAGLRCRWAGGVAGGGLRSAGLRCMACGLLACRWWAVARWPAAACLACVGMCPCVQARERLACGLLACRWWRWPAPRCRSRVPMLARMGASAGGLLSSLPACLLSGARHPAPGLAPDASGRDFMRPVWCLDSLYIYAPYNPPNCAFCTKNLRENLCKNNSHGPPLGGTWERFWGS